MCLFVCAGVQDEIKTGSQELANLETRLSLSKDFLDELNGDILPAARQKDINQNGELANLMNAVEFNSSDNFFPFFRCCC